MITYKYVFTFGKHKGKTVKQVMEEDASYLLWADDNVEGFELSDYLRDQAEQYSREDDMDDLIADYMAEDWGDRS
jgi:DNA recombination-dependent growth factor C